MSPDTGRGCLLARSALVWLVLAAGHVGFARGCACSAPPANEDVYELLSAIPAGQQPRQAMRTLPEKV